jgi:hypothetical protein
MSRRLKNMYTYNARSRVFRTILPGLGHIQQLPIRLLNNLASLCLYTHTHSLSLSLSISILLSFFGGFCYDISKLLFGIFHHIYSSGKDGVVGGLVYGILCCMPVDGRSSFRHWYDMSSPLCRRRRRVGRPPVFSRTFRADDKLASSASRPTPFSVSRPMNRHPCVTVLCVYFHDFQLMR